MAVGRGGKSRQLSRDREAGDGVGYLSDESDFYGDEAVKQEYEDRANRFDPKLWWNDRRASLAERANTNRDAAKDKSSTALHNPYEGRLSARQLSETVDGFLKRLPPATTLQSGLIPWIFIANPYRRAPRRFGNSQEDASASQEAHEDDGHWAAFVRQGNVLLEQLIIQRNKIEKTNLGKTRGTINKLLGVERDNTVQKLLNIAIDEQCTSGKWMVFSQAEDVDTIWATVAQATANNELGIAAKVSPAPDSGDDRKPRLICIYTHDFSDVEDVCRVAQKLKDLGIIDARGRPIYYKCDAYTWLQLGSGNPYDIKASLFNSTDALRGKLVTVSKNREMLLNKNNTDKDGDVDMLCNE